jgi:nucleotide-binding universal stress UspA family protein
VLPFDGSVEANAAARIAAALADRLNATVTVVSVVDTTPVPIPFPLDRALAMVGEGGNGPLHQEQERDVRNQLSNLLEGRVDWVTSIELGRPGAAIAGRATSINAGLVVMGLRSHGFVDRVAHDETTLSVVRKAACPVLGVVAGVVELPRAALVAMDFSRASVNAAVAAAQLMAEGGVLTLAYVESILEYPSDSAEGILHRLGVDEAFARVEAVLATERLHIEHVIHRDTEAGSPSRFLLEYAKRSRVDLLAAGSARHGRVDRILLGSVSTELVRAGQISTLIVPPAYD